MADIKKIVIELAKEKELDLTYEEAKSLYHKLKKLFGRDSVWEDWPPLPVNPPQWPKYGTVTEGCTSSIITIPKK
jgi:hypothetical protein